MHWDHAEKIEKGCTKERQIGTHMNSNNNSNKRIVVRSCSYSKIA